MQVSLLLKFIQIYFHFFFLIIGFKKLMDFKLNQFYLGSHHRNKGVFFFLFLFFFLIIILKVSERNSFAAQSEVD